MIHGDNYMMAMGQVLARLSESGQSSSLCDHEFQVFSQFGDDGIIQFLRRQLPGIPPFFIEFGVENYLESNTRFLLRLNNWSGFVIDGDPGNVAHIRQLPESWRHDLRSECAFITKENINKLIQLADFPREIGILSIDLDGNDYWVYESIDSVDPWIVICEYNSVFGSDRPISVDYRKDFLRHSAHYSNLFYGASLPALTHLSQSRGYRFVGSNSAGNNAYFIREDLDCGLPTLSMENGYVESKFREGRSRDGELVFAQGASRLELIRGLDVVNVVTGQREEL